MKNWRMAMRVGSGGTSRLPKCEKLGVAGITYKIISKTNFSKTDDHKFDHICKQLAVPRKISLYRLVYQIKGGDQIYVKEDKMTIAKGMMKGPARRAYEFDPTFRIIDQNGVAWTHQVPVAWDASWNPIPITVGKSQRYAIETLSDKDVAELSSAVSTSQNWQTQGVLTYAARIC